MIKKHTSETRKTVYNSLQLSVEVADCGGRWPGRNSFQNDVCAPSYITTSLIFCGKSTDVFFPFS